MSEVKIICALIKIQSEVTNISKDTQGFGYKYAKLDSVLDMLRPIFNKHGVLIWQDVSSEDGEMVRITTSFIHESGEKKEQVISYPIPALAKMNSMQNLGSAISYLRRYCLMTMIGIAGTEDDDGKAGGDYIDSHKVNTAQARAIKNNYLEDIDIKQQRECKITEIHSMMNAVDNNEHIKDLIVKALAYYGSDSLHGLTLEQLQKTVDRISKEIKQEAKIHE